MATRAHTLGLLQRELRHAENVRADAYAEQLRAEIALLSAGSAANPARETLAREEVTGERPVRSRRSRSAG